VTAPQEEIVEPASGELPGIDVANVVRWLDQHVRDLEPPLEFALIAAGGSNLTYRLVDANGTRFILRRPPVGTLLATAHDMAREHRIMSALAGSAVPVPDMLALCQDDSVSGAPFYAMAYVEGRILRVTEDGAAIGEANAARASTSFVDTLAAIHTLEPAGIGLDTLSRPTGYVDRQLRRWFTQYQQTAGDHPNPLVANLHDRFAAHLPKEGPARSGRLVHGDYHIDNAVFDDDFAVISVFDWELCTLGDPLADLSWALMFWPTSPDELSVTTSPPTLAPGFTTKSQFIERYGAVSGLDLDDLGYFLALSHWKLACLIQGSLYRSAAGQGGGLQTGGGGVDGSGEKRLHDLLAAAAEFAADAGI
jgi:aminoglycoside phosphotransferase (APT) family kinase protein